MLGEMKAIRDESMGEWEEVLNQAKDITASYLDGISEVEKELLTRGKEMAQTGGRHSIEQVSKLSRKWKNRA